MFSEQHRASSLIRIFVRSFALYLLFVSVIASYGQFTFVTNNGAITITGYTSSNALVVIPDSTNGLPVTAIGTNVFFRKTNVTEVILPSNLRRIGRNAFASSGLSTMAIPNSVTNIEQGAFAGCSNLASVVIGTGVTDIGHIAFLNSGLENIVIPDSVTKVENAAFHGCANLKYAFIGSGLQRIEERTFSACAALSDLVMAYGVKTIETSAFESCSNLLSIVIPNSVTNIGDAAFYYCLNATNITLGSSVETIQSSAFGYCRAEKIFIPASVKSLAASSLVSSSLRHISADPESENFSSVDGVLFNKSQTRLLRFPGALTGRYTIPEGVANVGVSAFSQCSINNVIVPSTVAVVENLSFAHCTNMAGLYFQGNSPAFLNDALYNSWMFVYYLPGTTGWNYPITGIQGRPVILWNPKVVTSSSNFGVRSNAFGFTIIGTPSIPIVIESASDIRAPDWTILQSCFLTNGSIFFRHPQTMASGSRFYRLRSP